MSAARGRMVALLFGLALAAEAGNGVRADSFDDYTNPVLTRLLDSKNVREIKSLDAATILDNDRVLPGVTGAFLVVKTDTGRQAKLIVQAGRQKISDDKALPVLFIDRYVTYKEGEERQVVVSGTGQTLYPGFRFSLDLGQVVPEEVGGDLRFLVEGEKGKTVPVGKARVYLVTAPLPDAAPKKGPRFVMGDKFEPKYFNGSFKLYDDGRRGGTLKLKVEEDGDVSGAYYSDRDGQKYEVKGKIATPQHVIEFTVKFPRIEQYFRGLLFTGDGKAMAGTSRMTEREAGFYAVRVEE